MGRTGFFWRTSPRRAAILRAACGLLYCVLGWIGVQRVFLLLQESHARRLATRFAQRIEDHRDQATLSFLERELSDLARQGLIRCYRLSGRSLLRERSDGCGKGGIELGSSTVTTQVMGAGGYYWNISFETRNAPEFHFALYLMRALVIAGGFSVWIGVSRMAAAK